MPRFGPRKQPRSNRSGFAAAPIAPELVRAARIEGIIMRWEEHGDASSDALPIVMVHGIPTHPRLWRYVIPRLVGEGRRCLAWELVGYGWSMSEGTGRDISVRRQAEYLSAWLRHLGIERALFIGHDLGGGVVQRLVVHDPSLAAGLVLADCVAYDNWPVAPVRAARAVAGFLRRTPPRLLEPVLKSGLMTLGHDRGPRRKESVELHWLPYSRRVGPGAFAHQLHSLDPADTLEVAPELPRLRLPAHVIWGEHDPLGLASAKRLAADLSAPLKCIAGARHFTPEDHPDAIADAASALLESIGAQPAQPEVSAGWGRPMPSGAEQGERPPAR